MTIRILLPIMLASALIACNKATEHKKSCCSTKITKEVVKPVPGESIYNLASVWTSQDEKKLSLNHFRKKAVIAAMVFTHCESACPRLVSDMQRLESALTETELSKIDFVLISMDPERDTPQRFREFAAIHKLNKHWTLISSDQDGTTEIANVLGVRVKKLEGGGFDHSNVIFVLDQEGVIVNQQNGFAVDQTEILKSIKNLIQ